jgi:cAMP-dependent protein kinase regulator
LYNKTEHNSDEDDMDEDEQRKFAEKMAHKKVSKVVKTRAAVSAEVYGEYNKKEDFTPTVIPKTEEVKLRILSRLKQSFMFANLDDK